MKDSQRSNRETTDGELQHYLHERPALLLKMLDIAETCWHEREASIVPHVPPQTRRFQHAS